MKITIRHTRIIYLCILFILWQHCFNLVPFGSISSNLQYIILVAWICFGVIRYWKYHTNPIIPYLLPIIVLLAGFLLSMIPALLYHGQPICKSVLTYRYCYLYLGIVPLLVMAPSPQELFRSMSLYSIIYIFVLVIYLIAPSLIALSPSEQYRLDLGFERNINEINVPGYVGCAFPFIYLLHKIVDRPKLNDVLFLVILFAVFIVVQNRSTLFTLFLLCCLSLFEILRRQKVIYSLCLCVAVLLGFVLTRNIWMDLFHETIAQLSDPDYNRLLALAFVLAKERIGFLCYFLGEGNVSLSVSDYYLDLMQSGIYMNDIGLFGTYFTYGLIPICVCLYFYSKCLISKRQPYFMKLFSCFFLLCSLTIFEMTSDHTSLMFSIFLYLFFYYQNNNYRTV